MNPIINIRAAAAVAVTALALAACGGSDGDNGGLAQGGDSNSESGVSASFDSAATFLAFVRQLVATEDDTGEPLALPRRPAPVDNTSEPLS